MDTTDHHIAMTEPHCTCSEEIDELREHIANLRAADKEMEALRDTHIKELMAMQRDSNGEHFHRLNENMARTIEERSHFLTKEVFDPFRETVLAALAIRQGKEAQGQRVTTVAIGAIAIAVTIIIAITNLIGGLLAR